MNWNASGCRSRYDRVKITFRSSRLTDRAVALIAKAAAEAAGLDPARVSGHSFGRGLITTAAGEDVSEEAIARQSGHKSRSQFRKCVEAESLFGRDATAVVGL